MIYLTDTELTELVQKNGITSEAAQEAANGLRNTSITVIQSTKKVQRTLHNGIVSLKYGAPFEKMCVKALILCSLLPEAEESYGYDAGDGIFARWSRDTANTVGGLTFKLPDEVKKEETKAKPESSPDDEEL